MIQYLTDEDEHYCQLRVKSCDPEYAAMVSRDYPIPGVAKIVGAINEASGFIQRRFIELGRPDLIPPFEHPAPRMRGIEEAAHLARVQELIAQVFHKTFIEPDPNLEPHPFEGLKTFVSRQ